ncbi:MAG: hypothetical protein GY780_19080 [bacterium]|nr:hypothetical protein [bacterium]
MKQSDLNRSLEALDIHQLEERLEVSSLMPNGGISDHGMLEGGSCHEKCHDNDINFEIQPIDSEYGPGFIDTGE